MHARRVEMVMCLQVLCIYLEAFAKHEQTVLLQLRSVEGRHSNVDPGSRVRGGGSLRESKYFLLPTLEMSCQ